MEQIRFHIIQGEDRGDGLRSKYILGYITSLWQFSTSMHLNAMNVVKLFQLYV